MRIEKVDSSAVLKIGYDGANLLVQYVGGDWYKYLGVPETVFEQILSSPSKGAFVNQRVKPVYRVVPLTNRELETVRQSSLQ